MPKAQDLCRRGERLSPQRHKGVRRFLAVFAHKGGASGCAGIAQTCGKRYTFYVKRCTFYVKRYTFWVKKSTFRVKRYTLYAVRYTF